MNTITKLLTIATVSVLLASCGSDTPKENETAQDKVNPADLFKDDRPAYDANAIDANASIVEIQLSASGNTMAEMVYDQKEMKAKAGTTIKLIFKNNSTDAAMPHNWVLVHNGTMEAVATAGIEAGKAGNFVPNSKDVLVATNLLGPGEETTLVFPAPPAGTYQFVCTYPGHWSIMNGNFIVE